MTKIQEGDRVRCWSRVRLLNGVFGTVLSVDGDSAYVDFRPHYGHGSTRCTLSQLTKAESDSEALTSPAGVTTPEEGYEAVSGDSAASESMSRGDALAHGERMQDYGHPQENFDRIAGMWSAYIGANLTAHDVANLMILLKVSRAKKALLGGKIATDTLDDIEGYVSCKRMLA